MPNYYSTAKSLGFDIETEEIDDDAVLYQQGIDTEELEIKPNEQFIISDDNEATIENENLIYKVISKADDDIFIISSHEPQITLNSGKYILHKDGETIEFLSSID